MTFFNKKSRFTAVRKKLQATQNRASLLLILCCGYCFSFSSSGQQIITPELNFVSSTFADQFSKIIVQDHKGRMKPFHTLSREVMRKVSQKENLYGLSADQIVLSAFADKKSWLAVPIIKLGHHEKIKNAIGVQRELAAYKDFFEIGGSYKLRDEVRRAYSLQPIDRGTYEKELMKLDERINIVSMLFSGQILKIVPLVDDPEHIWVGSTVGQHGHLKLQSAVAEKFFPAFQEALHNAIPAGNYSLPNQIISELSAYQQKHGALVMPSEIQINSEIYLNQLNVFNRLALCYSLLGIGFLILLFYSVFRDATWTKIIFKVLFALAVLVFSFHTLGLGLRWYVSERAPWSNGYESMIYIAWTSTLAGLIFTRKSAGGLAATMILAGSILLVAMLSYLDPEITPLVPVLRSYWLTIHVSLIAGSYGFLMLGAIIGFINLILIIIATSNNRDRIKRQITELSYISEITLIGGLVMISIGTYLGGVWANESWGRYWGWDAKETWALVTILVYAFILHMRLIPGLRGLYAFNLATLFGMASVIMTYFGVNYYLSGLHSYAAGDPIPIPNWVYISVAVAGVVGLLAFFRRKSVF